MINEVVDKAFRILKRNYGCPGKDGLSYQEIKKNYSHHRNIILSFYNTEYKCQHPNPVIICEGKITKKKRKIFVYNIHDRWFQMCLKLMIESQIELLLSPHVYAARNGKNRRQLFSYLKDVNPPYLLMFDIKSFYQSINRELLEEQLQAISVDEKTVRLIMETFSHAKKGLPLGNPLSSILSNFYLSEFDALFNGPYARFSDDIFLGMNNENEIPLTIKFVESKLKLFGLELNLEKIHLIQNVAEKEYILEYPWFEDYSIQVYTPK